MKNILVVGGAGYIGSHCVKDLTANGYKCVVVDNLEYGHLESIANIPFERADLRDKASLTAVFKKHSIDAVVHFAAYASVGESVQNPQKYYENNVIGTLNLLSAMLEKGVKKIVFSSTCATYGNPQYMPLDEEHPQNPINAYGWSKLMVEKVLADYHRAHGLQYAALRYFNASGAAGDGSIGESHDPETHLIPLVLQAIQGKRPALSIFGTDYPTKDGTCIRDYIHVMDLAVAHRLALEKLETFSGCVNLGTGVQTTVKDLISAAEKVTGKKCPVTYGPRRAGDPAQLTASNKKALDVLGWKPQYTDIAEILETAWSWEQNRKY